MTTNNDADDNDHGDNDDENEDKDDESRRIHGEEYQSKLVDQTTMDNKHYKYDEDDEGEDHKDNDANEKRMRMRG